MLPNPERLYFDLGRLLGKSPDLVSAPIDPEVHRWLSEAVDLVRSSGSLADVIQLTVAAENLDGPLRAGNAETITTILRRVLATLEEAAPREVRGSVLLMGDGLDPYQAVRRLLNTAAQDALFVEPAAMGKLLADYAILAPERVAIRILVDEAQFSLSLIESVDRWHRRFGQDRILNVRMASSNSLHERLIILDAERAWGLEVSFNELAKQTQGALVRLRPEEEVRKISVYEEIWQEADPLSSRD
ncbi:MAG: hypothetical protein IT537_17525 [Hyphomicrobiales bacterium]|nr:hypothetical protein [Hyphomicrobiales bacterium]